MRKISINNKNNFLKNNGNEKSSEESFVSATIRTTIIRDIGIQSNENDIIDAMNERIEDKLFNSLIEEDERKGEERYTDVIGNDNIVLKLPKLTLFIHEYIFGWFNPIYRYGWYIYGVIFLLFHIIHQIYIFFREENSYYNDDGEENISARSRVSRSIRLSIFVFAIGIQLLESIRFGYNVARDKYFQSTIDKLNNLNPGCFEQNDFEKINLYTITKKNKNDDDDDDDDDDDFYKNKNMDKSMRVNHNPFQTIIFAVIGNHPNIGSITKKYMKLFPMIISFFTAFLPAILLAYFNNISQNLNEESFSKIDIVLSSIAENSIYITWMISNSLSAFIIMNWLWILCVIALSINNSLQNIKLPHDVSKLKLQEHLILTQGVVSKITQYWTRNHITLLICTAGQLSYYFVQVNVIWYYMANSFTTGYIIVFLIMLTQIILLSIFSIVSSAVAAYISDSYIDQLRIIIKKQLRKMDQGEKEAERDRTMLLEVLEALNQQGYNSGMHYCGIPINASATTIIFTVLLYSISAVASTFDPSQL